MALVVSLGGLLLTGDEWDELDECFRAELLCAALDTDSPTMPFLLEEDVFEAEAAEAAEAA